MLISSLWELFYHIIMSNDTDVSVEDSSSKKKNPKKLAVVIENGFSFVVGRSGSSQFVLCENSFFFLSAWSRAGESGSL